MAASWTFRKGTSLTRGEGGVAGGGAPRATSGGPLTSVAPSYSRGTARSNAELAAQPLLATPPAALAGGARAGEGGGVGGGDEKGGRRGPSSQSETMSPHTSFSIRPGMAYQPRSVRKAAAESSGSGRSGGTADAAPVAAAAAAAAGAQQPGAGTGAGAGASWGRAWERERARALDAQQPHKPRGMVTLPVSHAGGGGGGGGRGKAS